MEVGTIRSLDDMEWNDLDVRGVGVGDMKAVDFGDFGVHDAIVVGIDCLAPESVTFLVPPFTVSSMGGRMVAADFRGAGAMRETLETLRDSLPHDLRTHLPKMAYAYEVDGNPTAVLADLMIPSIETLSHIQTSLPESMGEGWWMADGRDGGFLLYGDEKFAESLPVADPTSEHGVALVFTFIGRNEERLNHVGVRYPESIGDLDVTDCITFTPTMAGSTKVFYPLLFTI